MFINEKASFFSKTRVSTFLTSLQPHSEAYICSQIHYTHPFSEYCMVGQSENHLANSAVWFKRLYCRNDIKLWEQFFEHNNGVYFNYYICIPNWVVNPNGAVGAHIRDLQRHFNGGLTYEWVIPPTLYMDAIAYLWPNPVADFAHLY